MAIIPTRRCSLPPSEIDPFLESMDFLRADGFHRVPSIIRVGTRSFQSVGPLGTTRWQRSRIRDSGHPEGFQDVVELLISEAIIQVHGLEILCYTATMEQLRLLDNTFPLVPPDHLECVLSAKPGGFHMVQQTGRGSSRSYMGGLNPSADYSETSYDETRCILITYGALWQNRDLGICPTVLHEIGHIMTHAGNGLTYETFDSSRRERLVGTRVSRNPGSLEALCNAYMYFLCYGADSEVIRAFGTGHSIQNDRQTRDALRRSAAFTRLPGDWQRRYMER